MMDGFLTGYVTVMLVLLGALLQMMISYLTAADWFALPRRFLWPVVAAIPVVAPFGFVLCLGAGRLYPWTAVPGPRPGWWSLSAFTFRTALYIFTWSGFAIAMLHAARAQDNADVDGIVKSVRQLRRLSASGAIAVALTLTFAAFDWVMSRESSWTSTIFGVHLFATGYAAAIAVLAIMLSRANRATPLGATITSAHRSAAGTLLFMAVMLNAYIAFAQFLIIWIGNMARDAGWLVARGHGGWQWLGGTAFLLSSVIPFAVLLFRRCKESPTVLSTVGTILLLGFAMHVCWLVLPDDRPHLFFSWPALVTVLTLAATTALAARRAWRTFAALPLGDPALEASLSYRRK